MKSEIPNQLLAQPLAGDGCCDSECLDRNNTDMLEEVGAALADDTDNIFD